MQQIRHTLQAIIIYATFGFIFALSAVPSQANGIATSISIESIGVETVIVEAPLTPDFTTWDVSRLHMNVGYLSGTSWFGSGGNTILGGHSETADMQPDVFYNLETVQVNDLITVNANGTEYQYVVTEVRSVSQYDVSVVYPTGHEQLTLITCQRSSYDGNSYQNRVVVIAMPL